LGGKKAAAKTVSRFQVPGDGQIVFLFDLVPGVAINRLLDLLESSPGLARPGVKNLLVE
jgi:hypothetical protein